MIMNIPKNCRECEHDTDCRAAHYGAAVCEYEEEINGKTIDELLSEHSASNTIA